MRRLIAGVMAAIVLLAASGCSEDSPEITTDFPTELEVTVEDYSAFIAVPPGFEFTPGSEVIQEGLGTPMRQGDVILMRIYSMEIETGTVLLDTFSELPDVWTLDPQVVGADVYNALVNQKLGSHIVVQSETSSGPVATLIETRPVRAIGHPTDASVPLGELVLGDDGQPEFTVDPDSDFPNDLTVFTTIFGGQEQIVVGDELLLQYVLIEWPSGEVIESTWDEGMVPIQLGAGDDNVLGRSMVEVPGRSQVMVIVPVSGGQTESEGTVSNHIFIIDIIWVQPGRAISEEEELQESEITSELSDEPTEETPSELEGEPEP